VEGFIGATTVTNIYYIVRKAAGLVAAQDAIAQILMDLHNFFYQLPEAEKEHYNNKLNFPRQA
jgi:hypothetical protein